MNTPIEMRGNLPPKASNSVVEDQSVLSTECGSISDTSEENDYVTSLQRRLERMENELQELKRREPRRVTPRFEPAPPVDIALLNRNAKREAKISRMSYKQFRLIKPDMTPAKATAAIIVCYDEKEMQDNTKRSTNSENEKTELRVPRQDASPTHIAINSQILADVITPEVDFVLHNESKIFIAPFKGIITYEHAIREAFKRRTAECESEKAGTDQQSVDPASTNNVAQSDTQSPGADSSPSTPEIDEQDQSGRCNDAKRQTVDTAAQIIFEEKCIERDLLGCLIEVMDTDLRATFELRRRLQDEKMTQGEVFYKDLWHLYKPGDIVVSNPALHLGPQQAYCVLHVTGGRTSYEKLYPSDAIPLSPTVFSFANEVLKVSAGVTPFVLDCIYIDYDGTKYGPQAKCVALQDYNGLKAIRSLELFPIRFSHETPGTYTSLVERGKQYASLPGGVSKLYKGLTMGEKLKKQAMWDTAVEVTQRKEVYSEIILDQNAGIEYRESKPRYDPRFGGGVIDKATAMAGSELEPTPCDLASCSKCTDISVDEGLDTDARFSFIRSTALLSHATKDELTDDHYALLTPRMYGYALQERKWHAFNVEQVKDHEVDPNKLQNSNKSFDDLVLPLAHKTLLRALVSNQTKQFRPASTTPTTDTSSTFENSEDISMDLVRGKGKGVIILLHGVPGVGKTSTAECVASHLGRPLFPITCGDLGVDAKTVETRLEEYFTLASRWGCVLLLDEADVFLAKRSEDQLKRNALVSVFLRVLEYYSGVLMLTTNRVGSFDEAFRSRIHVSLYYPKLGKEETSEIWDMNLRRIKEARDVEMDIDEAGIRKFYKKHWKANEKKTSRRWNGRQIKNAFQTALALANWDFQGNKDSKLTRPKLEASHFKQVAKTSNHFDDYLAEVFREGEDQYADMFAMIAKRENLRNDTDRGHRTSKQSKRRDRSEHSSSDSSSSDSDHTKRKSSKREKEKKKSRSKAKKSEVLDSASDDSGSESESKTESSESEPEKSRKKRKAPKKNTKKSKSKSKRESCVESGQEDASGSS
ncbi:hypothetical protein G6011_07533 [Alternaria panax]|uniref:AAA+ ATPase domain-containing protein n=1 Tax=Alternaria panax TaxID=48097 RepID=A0AAD4FF44_9PLEO|nr:hypothetical protein G6011_07533 [Alternaria panax]